jgi:hypothetical protein
MGVRDHAADLELAMHFEMTTGYEVVVGPPCPMLTVRNSTMAGCVEDVEGNLRIECQFFSNRGANDRTSHNGILDRGHARIHAPEIKQGLVLAVIRMSQGANQQR